MRRTRLTRGSIASPRNQAARAARCRLRTGEFAQAFLDSYHEGARTSIWGWYDDDIAFTADWGFDLASIRMPVTLWQGHQNLMVPPAHGNWLAAHVPGASARMEPEHGHLSLYVGSFGTLLDDMLENASP